jgi:hypothetical protein
MGRGQHCPSQPRRHCLCIILNIDRLWIELFLEVFFFTIFIVFKFEFLIVHFFCQLFYIKIH